jgi:hydrogenase maturation protease
MFPVVKNENADTLVLGVGNLLMADEGVGIQVIQRLQESASLPETVQVLDGGTLGMDLLYYLEGTRRLLIIDAVETGCEPGTVIRLENDEVPAHLSAKMSPHQVGIPDMLFAAKLRDLYPEKIVLLGVQPESLEPSLDLSPTVSALVDPLVQQIIAELANWGVPVNPLGEKTA